MADKNKTTCVCEDGWYGSEDMGCSLCEAGNYCTGGQKRPCEDHYYQEETGASACDKCSSTGGPTGAYGLCNPGRQLLWCLQTDPGSQNRTLEQGCVPCNQCKRHYITPITGQKDCYKNSA